jgi:DNA modification methylase
MNSLLSVHPNGEKIGKSIIVNANCFDWLKEIPKNSLHAVITDPPYGVKEYNLEQLEKKIRAKEESGESPLLLTVISDRLYPDLPPSVKKKESFSKIFLRNGQS